jgi:Family of unknown function (DUF5719)
MPDSGERVAEPRSGVLRRVATSAARSLLGLVGIAVAALVIGAAALIPLPSINHTAQSVTITPVPSAQQLICAGALLRLGDEAGKDATAAHELGAPTTIASATEGGVTSTPLEQPDAHGTAAAAPIVISAPPLAGTVSSATLSGAQSQSVNTGDFRGFAAAACARASISTWLVGGSTAVGRTTLLSLANPNEVVATVSLEVFGDGGEISAPGSKGIVVAAHTERVLSLAGFAPDLGAPVLHITSTGGPIAANLQQVVVRGISPGGVDIVGPTSIPAKGAVFPGVVVANSATVAPLLGEDGFKDLGTALRAFVPGDKAATARVSVVPEDPAVAGASFSISLPAGVVTDVPIDGLADGVYSISLESDVPVVAAVRASTVGDAASSSDGIGAIDFAWFTASSALTGSAFVAVASGVGAQLHFSNHGQSAEAVNLTSPDGTQLDVAVPAGTSVSVPVTSGASYRLAGFSSIYASVSFTGDGALASYPIAPSAIESAPIRIYQ